MAEENEIDFAVRRPSGAKSKSVLPVSLGLPIGMSSNRDTPVVQDDRIPIFAGSAPREPRACVGKPALAARNSASVRGIPKRESLGSGVESHHCVTSVAQ